MHGRINLHTEKQLVRPSKYDVWKDARVIYS